MEIAKIGFIMSNLFTSFAQKIEIIDLFHANLAVREVHIF
jgi:hypothetical protein